MMVAMGDLLVLDLRLSSKDAEGHDAGINIDTAVCPEAV
jgi:hypothetical protein